MRIVEDISNVVISSLSLGGLKSVPSVRKRVYFSYDVNKQKNRVFETRARVETRVG
jgi:hypothetical protein